MSTPATSIEHRRIYHRKDTYTRFWVPVTYDYTKSPRYAHSTLSISASFKQVLTSFAKDLKSPCLVSRLLLHATSYKMYCAKDHINCVSFRESKGLVSFIPFGKTQKINADGRWAKEGRQTMKPAKFARAVLNPRLVKRLNDKHFNSFATRFKAYEESVTATINKVSFTDAYTENEATWGYSTGSCMRNKPVDAFYSRFDCYPIAIKSGSNKNMGRAIVWNNVELVSCSSGDVIITGSYLDRIYAPPEFSDILIDYAITNNMIHRSTSGGTGTFYFDNKMYEYDKYYLRVRCKEEYITQWIPYLDTFRFGSCDNKTIYSKALECDQKYTFDATGGSYSDNGYMHGYVRTRFDGYQDPNDCLTYNGYLYKKGGSDTVICEDDNQYYVYVDPAIIAIDGLYYRRDSDKLAECYHYKILQLKSMMVKCYTADNKEILVHKKAASLYKKTPTNPVDSIEKSYTFKMPSMFYKNYYYGEDAFDEKYYYKKYENQF